MPEREIVEEVESEPNAVIETQGSSQDKVSDQQEKEELEEKVQAKAEDIGGVGNIPTALEETLPTEEGFRSSKKGREQKPKKSTKIKEDNNNNFTKISNQLEKQTSQLIKVGAISQTLQKSLRSSDTQSRMLKEIIASVKQLQRQIAQIQKAVEKVNLSRKK